MKPYYATKKGCFLHFLNRFKEHDIYVIADNVCDATHDFVTSFVPATKVVRTQLNNAGAFLHSVEFAIARFADDEKIYLVEDDYIHTKDAATDTASSNTAAGTSSAAQSSTSAWRSKNSSWNSRTTGWPTRAKLFQCTRAIGSPGR